jgi:hypothetical protein
LINENVGTSTLTLAPDGTWTMAQETERSVRSPVLRGTYSVTSSDSFEMRTTFPPDLVGELVAITWQVDGGTLQLRTPNPPHEIIRVQMETHPWRPKG